MIEQQAMCLKQALFNSVLTNYSNEDIKTRESIDPFFFDEMKKEKWQSYSLD